MTTAERWNLLVSEIWTILKVLQWTQGHFTRIGLPSPRLDAELIISHVLRLARIQLYAQFEKALTPEELASIKELIQRRTNHEPMAYILGRKEFYGETFSVDPSVLIPRPETEFIIEEAKKILPSGFGGTILDIGTGSGCLAIILKKIFNAAVVHATDISAPALDTAARNATAILGSEHGIIFHQSDIFTPLDGSDMPDQMGLIVSNPPYIPETSMRQIMQDVRDYEPHQALFSGSDGLAFIKRLLPDAAPRLQSGGILIFETGIEVTDAIKELIPVESYPVCNITMDYSGIERTFVLRKA